MAKYLIKWYKNEKYGEPIHRKNVVEALTDTAALVCFKAEFGNFKKRNTIESIQKLDEQGNPADEVNVQELIARFS